MRTASPTVITKVLGEAAAPLGATEIAVYLVDFEQVVLQPLALDLADTVLPEEDVASTMAGRAFRSGQPVVAERADGHRIWVPLMEQTDRTGVLALTVPAVDDEVLAQCSHLGLFAGLLVSSVARYTDLLHIRRRGRPMSLAAGMQWELLPPLIMRSDQAVSCGTLEPAYEIAGDCFDHALNGNRLELAVFDAMGHGIRSALMATLAVGAYRHGRRTGADLGDVHALIDQAVSDNWDGEGFVTGVLARLDLVSGRLDWTNAGHPPPLLLRDRHVVGELTGEFTLPFGLGGATPLVNTMQLQPDDRVLMFTDGVIEGRDPDGEEFGVDRLIDRFEREVHDSLASEEILRRLTQSVLAWQGGTLRDDSTLLLLHWTPESPGPEH
jgi:hypothetical protein